MENIEGGNKLFSVVVSDRARGNGHKPKHKKWRGYVFTVSENSLLSAGTGCSGTCHRVLILGDIQNPTEHVPEQAALADPIFSMRVLNYRVSIELLEFLIFCDALPFFSLPPKEKLCAHHSRQMQKFSLKDLGSNFPKHELLPLFTVYLTNTQINTLTKYTQL